VPPRQWPQFSRSAGQPQQPGNWNRESKENGLWLDGHNVACRQHPGSNASFDGASAISCHAFRIPDPTVARCPDCTDPNIESFCFLFRFHGIVELVFNRQATGFQWNSPDEQKKKQTFSIDC
jgi:hypothetical protein